MAGVWASSRRWRTGKPGILKFMGSQSWTWLSDWTTAMPRNGHVSSERLAGRGSESFCSEVALGMESLLLNSLPWRVLPPCLYSGPAMLWNFLPSLHCALSSVFPELLLHKEELSWPSPDGCLWLQTLQGGFREVSLLLLGSVLGLHRGLRHEAFSALLTARSSLVSVREGLGWEFPDPLPTELAQPIPWRGRQLLFLPASEAEHLFLGPGGRPSPQLVFCFIIEKQAGRVSCLCTTERPSKVSFSAPDLSFNFIF